MSNLRFDFLKINATKTDEGYLVDTPVLGRTGIQIYKNNDGSIRREFRPPEEVFAKESLDSFAGKPITDDHPADMVHAENAKDLSVGVIKSSGMQVDNNVVAPIIVLDASTIKKIENGKKQLSLGYTVQTDETPGEWQGQKYDAIQRNIRINHLAIVDKGRAGNARFNIDFFEELKLKKVRLDNGLEYDAAPEVAVEFDKLRSDIKGLFEKNADIKKQFDALSAERDLLKSKIAEEAKIRDDALNIAREELKQRAKLEQIAAKFDVDCAGKSDNEIKCLVIKSENQDINLENRSDEYIQAAFDIVVDGKKNNAIASQRKKVADSQGEKNSEKLNSYSDFMNNLTKLSGV